MKDELCKFHPWRGKKSVTSLLHQDVSCMKNHRFASCWLLVNLILGVGAAKRQQLVSQSYNDKLKAYWYKDLMKVYVKGWANGVKALFSPSNLTKKVPFSWVEFSETLPCCRTALNVSHVSQTLPFQSTQVKLTHIDITTGFDSCSDTKVFHVKKC